MRPGLHAQTYPSPVRFFLDPRFPYWLGTGRFPPQSDGMVGGLAGRSFLTLPPRCSGVSLRLAKSVNPLG